MYSDLNDPHADVMTRLPRPEASTFSRTKIQQPRLRVEQIPRPQLEQRLEAALDDFPLVLLSAPAGFGKTVLLSRVVGALRSRCAVAWVSADGDDDLQRLVQAMVAALEPFDLPWRVSPDAIGAMAASGHPMALDAMTEAMDASEAARGVLVIEDLHRLRDTAAFEWLDRLLERLPASWCLALSSRVDPPLALARMRVRGELAEFRADDLRFSLPEAVALASAGPHLEPDAIDSLWQRTSGWPVGLHLVLRTGHAGRAPWTADRHAFDYLASEVLAEMPAPLQDFLLRCAVLPELNATRCEAVSGDPWAARWLDEIERRGLFVTALDSAERTLRLHDLFREFLEAQLQCRLADELPQLLRRAADHESDPVRRVGYLLRARDNDSAERTLEQASAVMLLEGAGPQILRLLGQFPREVRESSPTLAFVEGLCAWPNFDWVTLQCAMKRAGDGFAARGELDRAQQACAFEAMALLNLGRLDESAERMASIPPEPANPEIAAFAELLRYWYTGACGPFEGPALHLSRMLDLLEHGASPERWLQCLPHFLFLGHPGVGPQMARYVERALVIAGESHPQLRAGANTLKAWLLMWDARLDDAEAVLRAAEEDVRWLGCPTNLHHPITVVHGVIHGLRVERAQRDAAVTTLAQVDNGNERRLTWQGIYLYQVSRWYLLGDDWSAIEGLMHQLNAKSTAFEWPYVQVARAALNALWALHKGDDRTACALLEPQLEAADRHDITSTRGNVRVTLALARARLGLVREAWEVVAPIVALSRQPGEKLSLLLCGEGLLRELAGVSWADNAPAQDIDWIKQMAQLSATLRSNADARRVDRENAIDVLSDRERDVLAQIAAGSSNKLIARALNLSPHTVKRHVANILDKLGATTRGQAAAWWHARERD